MPRRTLAIIATLGVLLLAGCSAGASQAASGTTDPAAIEAAKTDTTKHMAPRAAEESQIPTDGPAGVTGKSLVAITCAASIEGCVAISDAHIEAAKALGWETTIIDGKGSPQGWNDAMTNAIALHPDVIALTAILPEGIQGTLQQARDAGIKILCTQCGGSGEAQKLVDVANGDDIHSVIGTYLGDYVVAESEGKAHVLAWLYPEFEISETRLNGFKSEIDKCAGCTLDTFEVKISEWGTTLPDRIQALLAQNPDIDWIYSPADQTAFDAMNAVEAVGATGRIRVVGGNGDIHTYDTIRKSDVYVATAGVSPAATAWAGIDGINRLLAGEQPVESFTPVRLFDTTNADQVKAGTQYSGDVDFRSIYRKIWGL
ncbi:sugar ABC transporter substrate-binding protein (plasmid) [Rhodococcus globerulus]|uniref:sugar ABC transporter substrate-binding protein n=1 Tax=Rhodococcus globerulus TaxID=33008 RepID=UPI0039ED25FF